MRSARNNWDFWLHFAGHREHALNSLRGSFQGLVIPISVFSLKIFKKKILQEL
jgi:hypothetical protein